MQNNRGFTMIELIAVLLIISVITVFIVPKIIDLESSTEKKLLGAVLSELNARENMAWLDCKLSDVCVDVATNDLMGVSIDKKGKHLTFDGGGKYDIYRVDATDGVAARWYEGKKPKPPKKPKK